MVLCCACSCPQKACNLYGRFSGDNRLTPELMVVAVDGELLDG